MHQLEKNGEPSKEVLSHSCTKIDSIALVRKIKTVGWTDEDFVLKLFSAGISRGCSSTRVDVVFDVHREI